MHYIKKAFKHWIKVILGLSPYPRRYDQLYEEVDALHPRTICEIGTNDGMNAVRLYLRASQYCNDVEYFGFDLFESFDAKAFDREFSIMPLTKEQVGRFLAQKGVKKYRLFSGDTMESIPRVKAELPKMDLVFIDGGHSTETVASDWENVKDLLHEKSIVYFDDYPNWGVGPVVDSIDPELWDVQIMKIEDVFSSALYSRGSEKECRGFKFARVQNRLMK